MAETTKKRGRKPKAEKAVQEETKKEAPVTQVVAADREDEISSLRAMVIQLQEQLANQRPQVVQVMADTERVVMRFQAAVADDNVAVFGPDGMYGQVTGKTGIVSVPKAEWSRFYNESVRNMINRRWLIVLSGFDDSDRILYNCAYNPGEILDEMAFHKLLDMGRDLIAVFPALCEDHKSMVASQFIEAYEAGDQRANDRELIVALNELSKETYRNADKTDPRRKGLFWPIIEAMNEKDAE